MTSLDLKKNKSANPSQKSSRTTPHKDTEQVTTPPALGAKGVYKS